MYLITPMVYEKVKNHLDKSDKMALTNINKPYFTPKIEFHGAPNNPGYNPNNPGYNYPPYPPIPPYPSMPPTQTMPQQPTEFGTNPEEPYIPQYESRGTSDIGIQPDENPSEMEWTEYENLPPIKTEIETQTDLTIPPDDVPPEYKHQEIQTEPEEPQVQIPVVIPTSEQETQTDPPTPPVRKKIIPLMTRSTQTDPLPPTQKVRVKTKRLKIAKPIQEKPVTRVKRGPKKQIPSQIPVQAVDISQVPDQNIEIPVQVPVQEPLQNPNIQPENTSKAVVLYRGGPRRQQITPPPRIPSRTVSISRRQPTQITLASGVREAIARDLHAQHFGQQINRTPQYQHISNQPRAITYEVPQRALTYQPEPIRPALTYETSQPARPSLTYQQDIRTQPEYSVAIPESRTVSIPRPESLYTVEFPADEPPGMRSSQSSEITHPEGVYVHTPYQRKRKRKETTSTSVQTATTDIPTDTSNIDLKQKKSKKTFECDVCHAVLSSQYNLTRHKVREAKRFENLGRIPDEFPTESEKQPEFPIWEQLPKKRSSTDAKFVPRQHRKRVRTYTPNVKPKPKQIDVSTYTQWE